MDKLCGDYHRLRMKERHVLKELILDLERKLGE